MSLFLFICLLLTIAYAGLMGVYRRGWDDQEVFAVHQWFEPMTRISVIIPARNEQDNIGPCIRSVLQQDYPAHLVEVIVVDDHSGDDTAGVVQAIGAANVRVVSLKEAITGEDTVVAYKKKALATGISQSTGKLIVTTDADCLAPPGWLRHLAALYEQRQAAMIIAPVSFTSDGSLVQVFQSIDFMTMQGITAAAHRLGLGNMANGANLAFSRQAFTAVAGYEGIDHLASGDDYLLLLKIRKQFPKDVHFLQSRFAIMCTAPQPSWRAFLSQRIRWASKSGKYPDHRLTIILLLVYLFNLAFLPAVIVAVLQPDYWWLPAGMLGIKLVAELRFLIPVALFFGRQRQLWLFPLLQPLHIAYIILAGFLGMVGTYEWKGRRVR